MLRKINEATTMGFPRICGLAALGFAAMISLSNVIQVPAGLPVAGAGLGEVIAFFGTESRIVGIGSALTPAAWVLATMFGAGVVSVLWRSERRRGEAWSLLGLAGLVLQNAAFAGVIAIRLALTSTASEDTAPDGNGTAASDWSRPRCSSARPPSPRGSSAGVTLSGCSGSSGGCCGWSGSSRTASP
ncbi:hypothetical protein ABZ370_06100 [Streptomyces sp. NPDC005962]|uniref:hypothetical protein n=1 Tax=Streptomyces sp. NPDC005962 TaxID=3154466 RepID=UPI0034071804